MAIDITAIGIGVDTSKLRQGTKDLDSFGKSANVTAIQADKSTQSMSAMTSMAGRLSVILGAAGVGGILIKTVDEYTKLNAQLSIAARSQDDFAKSMEDVVRISNLAQTNLSGTATLYSRLANTLKDTNVTQEQFSNITETVALALRVSGAGASEAQSAMLQLSQAFASGVLRGEEFNAVSEAAFPLMKALADSMGIPIEKLRSIAHEGKITRTELVKAFSDPKLIESFKEQAKQLNTVGGALQVLKNNLFLAVGQINETTGASNGLAEALLKLGNSNVIKVPFEALAVLAVNVAYVFKQVGNEIGGIAAQLAALGRLDFDAFADIRTMMVEDAKKARIEIDALSEAILNPKTKDTGKGIYTEVTKVNTALKDSAKEAKKLADEEKKRLDAFVDTQNEMMELTKKYQDISMKTESKIIEETRDAKIKADKEVMEIRQRQADENFKNAQDIAKKETSAMDDAFKELKNSVDGYSRDMARSLAQFAMGGKVSFSSMIDSMLLKLLEFVNQKLIFDPLFKSIGGAIDAGSSGGGLGGLIGGIAGGIGNFFTGGVGSSAGAYSINENPFLNFSGGRANGGNVYAGKSYMVGERGSEMFVPTTNGSIVPNNKMGGGNTNVIVNVIEAEGTKANVQQQKNPDGTMSISVIVEQLYGVMNRDLQRGTGISPTLERRYGLNRLAGA